MTAVEAATVAPAASTRSVTLSTRALRLLAVTGRRVGRLLLLVFGATTFVFLVLHLSGDPASVQAGPNATEDQVAITRERLGLDRPLVVQYGDFVVRSARLDFGPSYSSGVDAFESVTKVLPTSLWIALAGTAGIAIVGTALGLLAATTRRAWLRKVAELLAFSVQGVPFFWLGLILVQLLAIDRNWFPATGSGTLDAAVLPVVCLMVGQIAAVARLTRGEVVDALAKPYVVTARSKGITDRQVLLRHVVPNVAPTLISFLAVIFTFTVGALIVVEPMFNYGGLGSTLVNAVRNHDFPIVNAGIFLVALLVGLASLIADVVATLCSPALAAQKRGNRP